MNTAVDLHLLTVLARLIADISDPEIHYLVTASYYDVDEERSYYKPVHFSRSSVFNIELSQTALICDAPVKGHSRERFRVHIPYDQIWSVARNEEPYFRREHQVYFNEGVMRSMFDRLLLNI